MPFMIFALLALYGTYRWLHSWRTGVYQLKFHTVLRAEQPGRFAGSMAFLGAGVVLAWILTVQQAMAMHISISFSHAA